MEKNLELKIMRCPTCGANLKVENSNQTVACVYCGNEIVPVSSASVGNEKEGTSMSVKVEGLKTPSSAIAYLELFFDDFDWDGIIYDNSRYIYELKDIADELKSSATDDKNTWIFCFKSVCRPFVEKVLRFKGLIDVVVSEYKNDNFDAYSDFDAYKLIAKGLREDYPIIIAELNKYLFYAEKYGATADELEELKKEIPVLDPNIGMKIYENIEDVPAIAAFIEEKNQNLIRELASEGINAQQEYDRAVALISAKEYVQALNILTKLRNYSDSAKLIKKIDNIFSISNIWEIQGNQYQLRLEEKNKSTTASYALYPKENNKFAERPVVKKITKLITNYADILYYLDVNKKIKAYDFKNKKEKTVDKKAYSDKNLTVSDTRRKAFIFTEASSDLTKTLCEINLADGTLKILKEKIKSVLFYEDGKFVITETVKNEPKGGMMEVASVFNVDDLSTHRIDQKDIQVCGYVGDSVVYTKLNPNKNNKALFIKSFKDDRSIVLLEANIFDFCEIISDKIYYYIGNSDNRILVNINPDRTGRKEISLYLRNVLFEQGGWLYFVRGYGYNTVICKSRIDGTQTSVICSDIDKFIEISNGYLYYINTSSSLMKVRMDGTNKQNLCNRVEKVLSIDGEKVIYVSKDNDVQSIYVTDPKVGGRMKLAYNVIEACEYDENFIYYIAKDSESSQNKVLYKMSKHTYGSQMLLTYSDIVVSGGCYVATSVYGSYDCPQVWTLRRFRDEILASTWYGRLFVYLYYAVSPGIVKLFGETSWFNTFWKGKLDKMVSSLQSNGFADTPYEDKIW